MNSTYLVDCPSCCERNAVEVRYVQEYQGEHPHGAMVDFLGEVVTRCKCELTAEQMEQCASLVDDGKSERLEDEW